MELFGKETDRMGCEIDRDVGNHHFKSIDIELHSQLTTFKDSLTKNLDSTVRLTPSD